jgi:hypothetical protein
VSLPHHMQTIAASPLFLVIIDVTHLCLVRLSLSPLFSGNDN